MNTTQTTIVSAARPGGVASGFLRRLLAAGLATILATWATSAPGFIEWESRMSTSARFADLPPMGVILLLALLPAWIPSERGLVTSLQRFARIGIGPSGRMPAGNEAGMQVGRSRWAATLRDASFRVHGCLAGVALGVLVAESAQASLGAWLFGMRFEGGAAVLSAILGVLSGAAVILALISVPRLAATWRIEGPVHAAAALQILGHGADLLVVTLSIYAFGYIIGWEAAPPLLVLPLVTLAALTGYTLPHLLWREKYSNPWGVWVVLLQPDDAGAVERALRQVDVLTHTWVHGPMTVVIDGSLDIGGEQLHAALTLGRERSMFPQIEVELADWGMLLPPPEHWLASPMRELHVPGDLMLPALERFAGAADLVVLVSSQVEPIHTWRKRFRHADILVAWNGDGAGPTGAIALDSLGERLAGRSASSAAAAKTAAPPKGEAVNPAPAPVEADGTKAMKESAKETKNEQRDDPEPMATTSEHEEKVEADAVVRQLSTTCLALGDEDTFRGTGFVVARGVAATADHVLGSREIGDSIPVRVGWLESRKTSAIIYRRDPENDIALLRLQHCDDIAPLPVRTDVGRGDVWVTAGFYWVDGRSPVRRQLTGSIVSSEERNENGLPRMSLACAEHVRPDSLAGLSGSPVVVDGALAGMIVGSIRNPEDPSLVQLSASPIGNLIALLYLEDAGSRSAPEP